MADLAGVFGAATAPDGDASAVESAGFVVPTLPATAVAEKKQQRRQERAEAAEQKKAAKAAGTVDDGDAISRRQKFQHGAEREDPKRLARTLFLANLPTSSTKRDIKRLVTAAVQARLDEGKPPTKEGGSEAGTAEKGAPRAIVESLRFRSVPLERVAVSAKAGHRGMRKAAFITKSISEEARTADAGMNAYVVLRSSELVPLAVAALHNSKVGTHTIRADTATPRAKRAPDAHKRSVFVGQIPFSASEQQLRSLLEGALADAGGSIDYIRLVTDRVTNKSKGIAYVGFADSAGVADALGLNGKLELGGRKLKLSRCKPITDSEASARAAGRAKAKQEAEKVAAAAAAKLLKAQPKAAGKPGKPERKPRHPDGRAGRRAKAAAAAGDAGHDDGVDAVAARRKVRATRRAAAKGLSFMGSRPGLDAVRQARGAAGKKKGAAAVAAAAANKVLGKKTSHESRRRDDRKKKRNRAEAGAWRKPKTAEGRRAAKQRRQ